MAPNPHGNPSTLGPEWVKGESGNPSGGSAKLRRRQLLRDFIATEVNERVDTDDPALAAHVTAIAAQLEAEGMTIEEAREAVAGLTTGQVIARQIVREAMGDGRGAAKARDQIISTEPKTIELEQPEEPKSPHFIPSEEEQAEVERAAMDAEDLH